MHLRRHAPCIPWATNATRPYDRGSRAHAETLEVEGEWTQIHYRFEDTGISPVRIYQSYRQLFEQRGDTIVFEGSEDELGNRGGVGFLTDLLGRPSYAAGGVHYLLATTAEEDAAIAITTYRNARPGGQAPLINYSVNVVEFGEVETLGFAAPAEEPEAPAEPPTDEPGEAPLVQPEVEELEAGLLEQGRVVVGAILFEFDRAGILPESATALATVAELLEGQPELRLLVVGHTDSIGDFDYNLRLSLDRTAAVVAWLQEEHAIAAHRLRPAGAGPMSPIASNRSEDGRSENRRVELVEIVDRE